MPKIKNRIKHWFTDKGVDAGYVIFTHWDLPEDPNKIVYELKLVESEDKALSIYSAFSWEMADMLDILKKTIEEIRNTNSYKCDEKIHRYTGLKVDTGEDIQELCVVTIYDSYDDKLKTYLSLEALRPEKCDIYSVVSGFITISTDYELSSQTQSLNLGMVAMHNKLLSIYHVAESAQEYLRQLLNVKSQKSL